MENTGGPIRFEVEREGRSDWATRVISILDNAPRYSYERSGTWRKPSSRTVTWQVASVKIAWKRGVIERVDVTGFRLKKDGTVGVVRESAYFRPMKEDPTRFTGYMGYERATHEWGWLNTLVAEHSTVPSFDAEAE